jgi:hypothetical protein
MYQMDGTLGGVQTRTPWLALFQVRWMGHHAWIRSIDSV